MKLFTAAIAVGLMTFFALGYLLCWSTSQTARAYCLEAPGQEPSTAYVSGPSSTIIVLNASEPGRYVVSEGGCKK